MGIWTTYKNTSWSCYNGSNYNRTNHLLGFASFLFFIVFWSPHVCRSFCARSRCFRCYTNFENDSGIQACSCSNFLRTSLVKIYATWTDYRSRHVLRFLLQSLIFIGCRFHHQRIKCAKLRENQTSRSPRLKICSASSTLFFIKHQLVCSSRSICVPLGM